MVIQELGDRMKEYEKVSSIYLPRRSYIIIRVDGIAFHTYTKGFKKPYDDTLISAMNYTAEYLCKNIIGAKLAFTQSDEVSIVVTDFGDTKTQAWFNNNLIKMVSNSASKATSSFNAFMGYKQYTTKIAEFDSRVYQIPQKTEVINYLRWRQMDTIRNSIETVARCHFTQSEMNGKNGKELKDMIISAGDNWDMYPEDRKMGRLTIKELIPGEARPRWTTRYAPDLMDTYGLNMIKGIIKDNDTNS
jgi:tRNA(His) 5'-end guanylyltransferase